MKKLSILSGLVMAAIISLASCQKEAGNENIETGTSASISAGLADTKTSNSGVKTLWAAGDAVNLFSAPAGTTSYYDHGEVALAGGENTSVGKFNATIPAGTDPDAALDWFLLYPYSSYVTTPGAHDSGFTYIGDSRGVKQNGNDNMEHLCGSACPLWGSAFGVVGDNIGITVHNIASVVEFNVKNTTGGAIVLKSVTMTASEDIVGSYFLDVTGDAPVITPSSDQYVYDTATVTVTDGAEVADGSTVKAYLPVKPYTQTEKVGVKVSVSYSQDGKTLSEDFELYPTGAQCVFTAGAVKKVGVALKGIQLDPDETLVSTSMEEYAKANNCTISAGSDVTLYTVLNLSDAVRMSTTGDPNCGSFWGTTGTQWRLYQNKQGDVTVAVADGCTLKSVRLTYSNTNNGTLLDVTGAPVASGDAYAASGNTVTFTVGNTDTGTNGQVRITDVEVRYTGSGSFPGDQPAQYQLSVDPESVEFTADGGSTTVGVTSDDLNWTVDAQALPSWLSASKVKGAISLTAAANPGDARNATVRVVHSSGTLTAEIAVSQEAAPVDPNLHTLTVNITEFAAENKLTLSSGNDVTLYPVLDLSTAVRMSTTGDPNCGSLWGETGTQWRLYQNKDGNVSVTVADGCTLKSVKFIYTSYQGGILTDATGAPVASEDTVTPVDNAVSLIVGNSGTVTNGQVRITEVEVKYTGDGTLPVIDNSSLSVNPESLTFDAAGGIQNVTVSCDNSDWTVVEKLPSWLSVSKAETFSGVIVTAEANTGEERSGTVTIAHSNGSLTADIAVTQSAAVSASSTIAEVLGGTVGTEYKVQDALVVAVCGTTYFIQDATGIMMAFNSGTPAAGDKITITGKLAEYKNSNALQFSGASIEIASSGNPVELNWAKWTGSDLEAAYSVFPNAAFVQFEASFVGSTNTGSVAGTDVKVYMRPGTEDAGTIEDGFKYDIKGIVYGWALYSGTKEVYVYPVSLTKSGEADHISLESATLSFEAAGGSKSVVVSSNDGNWTFDPQQVPEWLTLEKAVTFMGLNVTAAANTGNSRFAVITLTHSNGTDTATLTINQAGQNMSEKTVEVDFSAQGYANGTEFTSLTVNGVTVSGSKGDNSNPPKYYTAGSAVRFYGSNTLTVSAGKAISRIELTFGSGDSGSNAITADSGTFTAPVWEGAAGTVTFTIGGTTGHRRIQKLTVTYTE